jgi:hypothetical protein
LLLPHLDIFFNTIPNIHKNQAVRPLAKICEKLMIATYKTKNEAIIKSITEAHKSIIIECCFDWLITQQKVACQVYSMLALYFLGTQYDWIHPELKTIINKNIHQGSAAYKARGKYVLQQIEKFKAK